MLPFTDLERMGAAMAKSGLFGMKSAEQAIALMLVAQAEGQHPATIAQDYDIIQGKAARKTHSVLARFQAAGGKVEWHSLTATKADATFSHPQGTARIEWTLEQARAAGLAGKDNWKHYPRAMLRARCIAEGIRAAYPAAIGGMLITEEAQDLTPAAPRNMGAAVEVPQAPEALQDAAIKAADGGEQSLKDWWQSITKDERQMLAARLQELKTISKDADAQRTVDAEPAAETEVQP